MTAHDLPTWRLFWAKTDYQNEGTGAHDPAWTHPLWAHLLDVAHTALLLWERAVPDVLRREAADALGLGEAEAEAGHLLSLQIGLHDWGKATPHFQSRHTPSRDTLEARGLRCDGEDARHEHLTAALVHRQLQKERPSGEKFWAHLGASVGIHHGRLVDRSTWEAHARSATRGGALGDPRQWKAPQDDLHREVAAVWRRRYPWPDPPRVPAEPAPDWLLGLAGWTTFADWLGSISECFPPDVTPGDDLDAYLDQSRAGAESALARAGLAAPRPGLVARPFSELFEGFDPRPLQALVLDPAFPTASGARPTLTIVEAPTGEGKTEAALALAARQQDGRRGGLYLALPTQATANGLVDRAVRFLETAHAGGPADFRLAHGRAQLLDVQRALIERPEALGEVDGDARVRTLGWFLSSKRALLAPYGLGTIDQALLGAVRGRHFFLRLYGLAGKTVVLDEIHAYDVYMQTIIGRLLGWLRALGAHVVLLSATLPARLRADLIRAWDPDSTGDLAPADPAAVPYPAVWTVADGRVALHAARDGQPLRAERTQRATLIRHDHDPDAIAATVVEAAAAGAVVGVVVNTVARAQAVFEAVEQLFGDDLPADDVVLFHARFLQRDRARIERHVVGHKADDGTWVPGRFGKGRPPGPAVLVATQVAEQSLDLDLDLLLTDLAPVDLMLQRAGRLHRHDRTDRPTAYREPEVLWLCPAAPTDGLPDVRSEDVPFGFVYDPVVLWRTWRLLCSRQDPDGVGRWSLPADYRPLIETVYPVGETVSSAPPPPDGLSAEGAERWAVSVKEGRGKRIKLAENAADQLIPASGDLRDLFSRSRRALHDEDDEAAHHTLRVATREGDSVEVVVLFADDEGGLFLDPGLTETAPLTRPDPKASLPTAAVRRLLGSSVRLSTPPIIGALRSRPEADVPARWREAAKATPTLRDMHLLVIGKETTHVGGRRITFDVRLGILIERISA